MNGQTGVGRNGSVMGLNSRSGFRLSAGGPWRRARADAPWLAVRGARALFNDLNAPTAQVLIVPHAVAVSDRPERVYDAMVNFAPNAVPARARAMRCRPVL